MLEVPGLRIGEQFEAKSFKADVVHVEGGSMAWNFWSSHHYNLPLPGRSWAR